MSPALSGIMPDSFKLIMTRATSGRRDSSVDRCAGNMPAVASRMLAVPGFIRLHPHKNANAQRVATIAPIAVAKAAVHAPFR